MYNNVIHEFHEDLKAKVLKISNPIQMSEIGIALSDQALSKLKHIVEKESFTDNEVEIDFFKRIKPDPMSYYIYFSKVRAMVGISSSSFLKGSSKRSTSSF